jgi:hypothetical protein
MTSDSTPVPSSDRHHAEIKGRNTALRVEARWQKPLIAAGGGEAMLLVRVLAAAVGEAEAGRAAPLDVAFVLDRSGSMQGDKLDLAKEGVDLAVARLRDADRAALIVYDDEVDTVQPLAPATPRLKASLRLALHGVDSGDRRTSPVAGSLVVISSPRRHPSAIRTPQQPASDASSCSPTGWPTSAFSSQGCWRATRASCGGGASPRQQSAWDRTLTRDY